jgi:hypothetical protein
MRIGQITDLRVFRCGFGFNFNYVGLSMLEFIVDIRNDAGTVVLLKIANHSP